MRTAMCCPGSMRRRTDWRSAAASALHRVTSKKLGSRARSGQLQRRVGWHPGHGLQSGSWLAQLILILQVLEKLERFLNGFQYLSRDFFAAQDIGHYGVGNRQIVRRVVVVLE